ncbi:hypothetical protein CHLNCDRAFT_136911 [Chlorella variabilis]|uniref:Uncharacterized protein n=1 Tax=Chlorella variabilis TaxID=554065 RepID=E1ZLK0_CHLVA|nr:hypothetical protein CHLNCDRAFT_136911 [Chlorella variabilis]EFN53280.1 hypothetical protein CHLNCDRAFT_136911 [Chlorella variabilis]|eukprot:XP_005845382.1 hypothetical protein CHLNCDRAFT_136911 [Chlorella variabilis]
MSALMLQSPDTAAVGLFARNEIGICYVLAWWAYHYFPGGWVARAADLPPFRAACKVARSILRANTVVHRVNAAVKLHPGVVAAPLVLGTLGGCGGRLLVDAFSHCAGYKQGPNELSHPGYVLRSAATGALLQYLLVHVSGVLTSQQGLGLVISLYVAHSLATDLTYLRLSLQCT